MISSEDIEQAVSEQFHSLRAQVGLDRGLRRYDTEGGQQSGRPWRTSGFYVRESERSRLVLEVFSHRSGELAVVRVYRERRLKVLYARKLTQGPERLPLVLGEASRAFHAALLPKPFRGDSLDVSALPAELAGQVARLMLPTPPPMDIAGIEEG